MARFHLSAFDIFPPARPPFCPYHRPIHPPGGASGSGPGKALPRAPVPPAPPLVEGCAPRRRRPTHSFAPRGWACHLIGPAASRAGHYQRGVQFTRQERDFVSGSGRWASSLLTSTLLLPSRDFPLILMEALGLKKRCAKCLHDMLHANSRLLGSPVLCSLPVAAT